MAIIDSIEQIEEYVTVARSTNTDQLLPYLIDAQEKYIRPNLGTPLLQRIEAQTPDDPEMMGLLRKALVNLAFSIYMPFMQVTIDGTGAHQNRETALFQRTEDKLQQAFLQTGMNTLDTLLEYLESHVQQYPEYQLSPQFSIRNELFVNRTATFQLFANIQNSRLTFLALLPILRKLERQWLKSQLGDVLFEEFKVMYEDQTPAEFALILPHLQAALVYETIARATIELNVQISADGALSLSYRANSNQNLERAANERLLQLKFQENHKAALIEMEQLTSKLEKLKSKIPEFLESPLYKDEGGEASIENANILLL